MVTTEGLALGVQAAAASAAAVATFAAWKSALTSKKATELAQRALADQDANRCVDAHIRTIEQLWRLHEAISELWDVALGEASSDPRWLLTRMRVRAALNPIHADVPTAVELLNSDPARVVELGPLALEEVGFATGLEKAEMQNDQPAGRHKRGRQIHVTY